jgi:hypothetical protein
MNLPNADEAYVDRAKIVEYLLSATHPDGRVKARFFSRFGFKAAEWEILAEALRLLGTTNPVVAILESPYGTRYTVDGLMGCPDGRSPSVRTVWIVEHFDPRPRLITAHPK